MWWKSAAVALLSGATMSNLIFLGIATLAAALFAYNLRLYMTIRKTIQHDQKETKVYQVWERVRNGYDAQKGKSKNRRDSDSNVRPSVRSLSLSLSLSLSFL